MVDKIVKDFKEGSERFIEHLTRDHGVDPNQINADFEESKRSMLKEITEATRAVSYHVGINGGLCPSGPQDYTRADGQVCLKICGLDEDTAQKASLGLLSAPPGMPIVAEVKVQIQSRSLEEEH